MRTDVPLLTIPLFTEKPCEIPVVHFGEEKYYRRHLAASAETDVTERSLVYKRRPLRKSEWV